MSQETDALFNALFALEDVREIIRQTSPKHELSEEQKEKVDKALGKAEKALGNLRKWSK